MQNDTSSPPLQETDSPTPFDDSLIGQQPKRKTFMPTIAGIFLVIAGLLGLLTWIAVFVVDPDIITQILLSQPQELPLGATEFYSILFTCGIIGCIFSVFSLLGGIFSLTRKMWWFALLGSILGLFVIGTVFISSILSFVGLILIVLSKEEFH